MQANFRAYRVLDDKVKFLKGWFKDTLPGAPIRSLAILRLDGDYYESTMDALTNLYDKLSVGGYVIIDDYGEDSWTYCQKAVDDYRRDHGNRRADDPGRQAMLLLAPRPLKGSRAQGLPLAVSPRKLVHDRRHEDSRGRQASTASAHFEPPPSASAIFSKPKLLKKPFTMSFFVVGR